MENAELQNAVNLLTAQVAAMKAIEVFMTIKASYHVSFPPPLANFISFYVGSGSRCRIGQCQLEPASVLAARGY